MPKVKAWNGMLDLQTYEKADKAVIQLIDNLKREKIGDQIEIPVPIMYRLYHLGRAYDFQTMKLFRPQGKMILDWMNLQQLSSEIEFFNKVIKDPIISHFMEILTPLLNSLRETKGAGMVIVAPEGRPR